MSATISANQFSCLKPFSKHGGWLYFAVVVIIHCGWRLSAAQGTGDHSPIRIWLTNDHSVAVLHIPKQPHRFSIWQKINPVWWFGNADEPVAPKWYRPGQHFRTFLWHLRNPFHNFDCYLIGLSDKSFIRVGRYPEETFNPNGGWNWGVCRFHFLRFPYISYARNRLRAYFGWRPGGAFGIELKLSAHKLKPASAQPGSPPPSPAASQ